MGISKRLFDLAKANLNALLDKASGDSLDDLSDDELEAELSRRKERRRREDAESRARYSAEEAARARAEERAREAARARNGTAPPPRASTTTSSREREARMPPPPSLTDKRLRELYAQLEVPFGAPFEDVKKSFRRLMRKYHPDLHIGNPAKHKTATQLTMSLTQAYNELEQHYARGRRA